MYIHVTDLLGVEIGLSCIIFICKKIQGVKQTVLSLLAISMHTDS